MAPTTRLRTRKPRSQRRADLLQAAVERFTAKGIERTTIDEIVGAAGVAKGTFYLYFDSKEQVVAALRTEMVERSLVSADAFVRGVREDEPWAVLRSTIEGFVDHLLGNRDRVRLFAQVGISAATDEVFAECDRKVDEAIAAGIRAGIERGAFDVQDPPMTAALLRNAVEGTVNAAILAGDDPDRDRLLAAIQDLVRRAIGRR
jgi:AcrR family transcriptional regulator